MGKAKCFFKEANPSYIILLWFQPFMENKFLLVHGITNVRQCFISTEYLNLKQDSESEKQWINRPNTNVSWIKNKIPWKKNACPHEGNILLFKEMKESNVSKVISLGIQLLKNIYLIPFYGIF